MEHVKPSNDSLYYRGTLEIKESPSAEELEKLRLEFTKVSLIESSPPYVTPPLTVKYTRLTTTAKVPTYAHDLDAGCDLYADEHVEIYPGESKLVQCGIAAAILRGFEGQVRSRSGLALKHGIHVLNSPGTIDAGYTGPIGVILHNTSDRLFVVNPGSRIAQLVIAPVIRANFQEVKSLNDTSRGDGGFGSSGL